MQPGQFAVGEADLAQPVVALQVGAARAHRADVGDREAQCGLQQRHVELGVVGEDAEHRTGVGGGPREVAVGPVDDDLVGLGEACGGGEDGPGVADGDPVAEELPGPDQRGGEVDGAEDDHAGRGHAGLDQELDRPAAAGPFRADGERPGAARVQEGAGLGRGGPVERRVAAEPALVTPVGPDQERESEQLLGALGDPRQGRRRPLCGGRERCGEHRPGGIVRPNRCDQDVDDAAAGQADREGVLVAVAEALADGPAVIEGLPAQFVDRALHTSAGDRADGRAVAVDGEGGTRLAGRAAADRHHGGDGELASLRDPPVQLFGDVQHGVSP
ncbi:hypothetical protein SMICM17S_04095 [Streptomyces microflavus]